MKNTLLFNRKTTLGNVKLKARKNGDNPASLYLEIYDKSTQKRTLQFLDLYFTGNEAINDRLTTEGVKRCNEYSFGAQKPKITPSQTFTAYIVEQVAEIDKVQSRKSSFSALKKLKEYAKQDIISWKRLDSEFLKGFRQFLLTKAISETDGHLLDKNTADNYLSIIMRYANRAQSKGFISPYAYDRNEIKAIGKEINPAITFSISDILKLQATPYPALPNLPKVFMLQFACLQRWSDVSVMTWETLNNNDMFNYIRQIKTGNIAPTMFDEALLNWIADGYIREGKIFTGFPKDTQTIREHLRAWCKLAGVYKEGLGTHTFRRSGATILHKEGVSLLIISKLLGHASVEQTKVYIGVDNEDIEKAINRLNASVISKFNYTPLYKPYNNQFA
jgi:integrase